MDLVCVCTEKKTVEVKMFFPYGPLKYLWVDEMDANNYNTLKKNGEIPNSIFEAAVDVYGDKILMANFNFKVPFLEDAKPKKILIQK